MHPTAKASRVLLLLNCSLHGCICISMSEIRQDKHHEIIRPIVQMGQMAGEWAVAKIVNLVVPRDSVDGLMHPPQE